MCRIRGVCVCVCVLTGKKPGGMGPPGMPSLGGIWLRGLGAGPAFCIHIPSFSSVNNNNNNK